MKKLDIFQELEGLNKKQVLSLEATVSLFDHLGYPAGKEIGKEVYDASVKEKEPVNIREVKTKRYTGKVMLYRKEFLKKYFKDV